MTAWFCEFNFWNNGFYEPVSWVMGCVVSFYNPHSTHIPFTILLGLCIVFQFRFGFWILLQRNSPSPAPVHHHIPNIALLGGPKSGKSTLINAITRTRIMPAGAHSTHRCVKLVHDPSINGSDKYTIEEWNWNPEKNLFELAAGFLILGEINARQKIKELTCFDFHTSPAKSLSHSMSSNSQHTMESFSQAIVVIKGNFPLIADKFEIYDFPGIHRYMEPCILTSIRRVLHIIKPINFFTYASKTVQQHDFYAFQEIKSAIDPQSVLFISSKQDLSVLHYDYPNKDDITIDLLQKLSEDKYESLKKCPFFSEIWASSASPPTMTHMQLSSFDMLSSSKLLDIDTPLPEGIREQYVRRTENLLVDWIRMASSNSCPSKMPFLNK